MLRAKVGGTNSRPMMLSPAAARSPGVIWINCQQNFLRSFQSSRRRQLLRVGARARPQPAFRTSCKPVNNNSDVGENGRRFPSGHSTRLLGCRPSPSCSVRTSFTKKVREHKPTQAAPTHHAAADQQASKPMLVAATLVLLLVDVVIVLFLAPLSKEACE